MISPIGFSCDVGDILGLSQECVDGRVQMIIDRRRQIGASKIMTSFVWALKIPSRPDVVRVSTLEVLNSYLIELDPPGGIPSISSDEGAHHHDGSWKERWSLTWAKVEGNA
jgi:hypothetical protein